MDTYAQRFDAINASVERQALFQTLVTLAVLGLGCVLVIVSLHDAVFATFSHPLLAMVATGVLGWTGMLAAAFHPRVRAWVAQRIADAMVSMHDPLIMNGVNTDTINDLLAPVLKSAGIAAHPGSQVVVAVHFHHRDRSRARKLDVRVGGRDVPNLPQEVYAALALSSSPSGRWGREDVRPIWYIHMDDPQPSAHARLRWAIGA